MAMVEVLEVVLQKTGEVVVEGEEAVVAQASVKFLASLRYNSS